MTRQPTSVRDVLRRESEATLRWALSMSTDSDWKRVIVAELGRRRARDAAPDLLSALVQARTANDWRVVEAVAEALGRIGFESAGPFLTELLSDPQLPVGVRDTAAFALGRIEYRRAIPNLITALSDRHKTVRLCAAASLAALADASIMARVEPLLPTETDTEVRDGLERLLSTLRSRPCSSRQEWLLAIVGVVGARVKQSVDPHTQPAVQGSSPHFSERLLRPGSADPTAHRAGPQDAMNAFRLQSMIPWRSPNNAESHALPRRHQAWPGLIASEA